MAGRARQDRRLSDALPQVGVYIDSGEPGAFAHKKPIPRAALTKFGRAPGVSRVFDSGDIAIYDVAGLGPVRIGDRCLAAGSIIAITRNAASRIRT